MNIIAGEWMHLNKKQRAILLLNLVQAQALANKKSCLIAGTIKQQN